MFEEIKNLILVASGKGGVGKSTVATNLALALARQGLATGLLDADIYGPSIPTLLGPATKPGTSDGKRLLPVEKYGLKLMSMGYLVDPDAAMIWRGPMLAGAVTQFVSDVDWGALDYLIFDLPPGTGDIQLSLAQKFKVTGALLVTTPQDVAVADVVRAKAMFDKVRINVLGLIENMSYFVCPSCSVQHDIFSSGGGEKAAAKLGVDFLGGIPLEPAVRQCGDAGTPLFEVAPDSLSAQAFVRLAKNLTERVDGLNATQARMVARQRSLPIIRS
jgi:ATP-binding protein involved in chromosome partitioning